MTGIVGLLSKSNRHKSVFSQLRESISNRGFEKNLFNCFTPSDSTYQFSLSIMLGKNQDCRLIEIDQSFVLIDTFYLSDEHWDRILKKMKGKPVEVLTEYLDTTLNVIGYVILFWKNNEIHLYRSKDGGLPVHYVMDETMFAFCTEKKGFYRSLQKNPEKLEPGEHIIWNSKDGAIIKSHLPEILPETQHDENTQLATLETILLNSFKRIAGISKCGILFSGGVDSSLAALLTSRFCEDTVLFSAFAEKSHDDDVVINSAKLLGLPLIVTPINEDLIWQTIPELIYAIESSDRMQIEIALPFFISAKTASELDYLMVISGQGPDELFAGYAKHLKLFQEKGEKALEEQLKHEVSLTHDNNLERDERAVAYHGLRIFFPYTDPEFVRYSLSIPSKFKIDSTRQIPRKVIFRQLARKLGLPTELAMRPKKATQYSSGTSRAMFESMATHCKGVSDVSRKVCLELIQSVLDTMAHEIGYPVTRTIQENISFEREPLDRLLAALKVNQL